MVSTRYPSFHHHHNFPPYPPTYTYTDELASIISQLKKILLVVSAEISRLQAYHGFEPPINNILEMAQEVEPQMAPAEEEMEVIPEAAEEEIKAAPVTTEEEMEVDPVAAKEETEAAIASEEDVKVAQQPNVPKIGSRAAEEPKQHKFGNPRKTRTNPIEFQMNRSLGPAQASKPNPPPVAKSPEGGQFKKADDAVPRPDNASLRPTDSHQRHGGRGMNLADSHAKPHAVRSPGVSVEHSPRHHRTGGRGSSSQPSSSDSLPGASWRPRSRPTGRPPSNQPVGSPTVPEFGDWNKNPEQAESYTDVFNRVLMDKMPGHNASNSTPHNPLHTPKKTEGNCFSRYFRCFSSQG